MELTMGGKTYTITPLTISEIHSHFESKIKQKSVDDARMMASALPPEDRIKFVTAAWKDMPAGQYLEEKVAEYMNSMTGIQECFVKAISKIVPIAIEEVQKYVNLDTLFDFIAHFYFLVGVEQSPESTKEKTAEDIEAEKK